MSDSTPLDDYYAEQAAKLLQSPPISARDNDLRDRFAMAALTGILADSPATTLHPNISNSVSIEAAAGAAYKFADAMLSARAQ